MSFDPGYSWSHFSRAASVLTCLIIVTLSDALWGQDVPLPYRTFEKTNQVVLDVGRPESFDSTQAKYPSVLKVDGEWWMWYNDRADDRFTGSIGLEEHPQKPFHSTSSKHSDEPRP